MISQPGPRRACHPINCYSLSARPQTLIIRAPIDEIRRCKSSSRAAFLITRFRNEPPRRACLFIKWREQFKLNSFSHARFARARGHRGDSAPKKRRECTTRNIKQRREERRRRRESERQRSLPNGLFHPKSCFRLEHWHSLP